MGYSFATLTPVNVHAMMAFSDNYDAVIDGGQKGPEATPPYMTVQSTQEHYPDVVHYRLEMQQKLTEGYISESLTELDSDNERQARPLGMIWKGFYKLELEHPPATPELGWILGKKPKGRKSTADIILCNDVFARNHNLDIRSSHARLNFNTENGAIFIASISRSPSTGVTVNGEVVRRDMHVLNQHEMKIWVHSLEYKFKYTNFASSTDYLRERKVYLTSILKAPINTSFDMPTPQRNTRTIGQWTLNDSLGKGVAGRVFLASNSKNEVVAVKIMEYNSKSARKVDEEITQFQELKALAEKSDDGKRLVRLKEIIGSTEGASLPDGAFEDVALILEPMTPQILEDLIGKRSAGGCYGISIEVATIFRDALLGLEFLHYNGWLHRDIKPQNIGVLPGNPPRAILLDIGQAMCLKDGLLKGVPGKGGTINYLAPEREMSVYDYAVDVWSMAVIGFELTYGYHPFRFAINPWRPGEVFESLRPIFQEKYQQAVNSLSSDSSQYINEEGKTRNPNFIHVGTILVLMLRHSWAVKLKDRLPRIGVSEALHNPVWQPLLPDSPQIKRARSDAGS